MFKRFDAFKMVKKYFCFSIDSMITLAGRTVGRSAAEYDLKYCWQALIQ